MKLIQSDDLVNHLQSIIHQDTQQHATHFDLTVGAIHRFTSAASLDFGGSEFEPAETKPIAPQKKDGDDYGWWHLSQGTYQATLNEKITTQESALAFISPHSHLQQAGIIANTQLWDNNNEHQLTINLQIPDAGCNIKENARIAVLYLLAQ